MTAAGEQADRPIILEIKAGGGAGEVDSCEVGHGGGARPIERPAAADGEITTTQQLTADGEGPAIDERVTSIGIGTSQDLRPSSRLGQGAAAAQVAAVGRGNGSRGIADGQSDSLVGGVGQIQVNISGQAAKGSTGYVAKEQAAANTVADDAAAQRVGARHDHGPVGEGGNAANVIIAGQDQRVGAAFGQANGAAVGRGDVPSHEQRPGADADEGERPRRHDADIDVVRDDEHTRAVLLNSRVDPHNIQSVTGQDIGDGGETVRENKAFDEESAVEIIARSIAAARRVIGERQHQIGSVDRRHRRSTAQSPIGGLPRAEAGGVGPVINLATDVGQNEAGILLAGSPNPVRVARKPGGDHGEAAVVDEGATGRGIGNRVGGIRVKIGDHLRRPDINRQQPLISEVAGDSEEIPPVGCAGQSSWVAEIKLVVAAIGQHQGTLIGQGPDGQAGGQAGRHRRTARQGHIGLQGPDASEHRIGLDQQCAAEQVRSTE